MIKAGNMKKLYIFIGLTLSLLCTPYTLLADNDKGIYEVLEDIALNENNATDIKKDKELKTSSLKQSIVIPGYIPRRMKRFYGRLEFGYLSTKIKFGATPYKSPKKTEKSSFIQEYKFGYENYLYSPRLFVYDLSSLIHLENGKTVTENYDRDFKIRNFNYRLNFDVIQGTKYPFTLYLEKRNYPFWNILENSTIYTNQEELRFGIRGSYLSDYFTLRYDASQADTDIQRDYQDETITDNIYNLFLERVVKDKQMNLKLSHRGRGTKSHTWSENSSSTDRKEDWKDSTNEIRADYKWLPSDTFKLRSYLQYLSSDYSGSRYGGDNNRNLQRMIADIKADWIVNKKLNVYGGLSNSNNIDPNIDSNNFVLSQGLTYQMTQQLSLNQDLSYFNITGDNINRNIASFGIGSRYNDRFSETFSYHFFANINEKIETGNKNNDLNSTLSPTQQDNNSFSYTVGTGLNKQFNFLSTSFNLGTSYYNLTSSTDEALSRFTINSSLSLLLGTNLSYTASANYSKSNDKRFVYSSEQNATVLTDRKIEVLQGFSGFNYWNVIGINGNYNINIGVNYIKDLEYEKVNPFANIGLTYVLWQNLVFTTKANVYQDSRNDYTNYLGFAGLELKVRKIKISLNGEYAKYTDGGSTNDNNTSTNKVYADKNRQRIYLRFVRQF